MKVWLVENCYNNPGRIEAIFRHEEDANWFADALDYPCSVEARNIQEGQPVNRGYNE